MPFIYFFYIEEKNFFWKVLLWFIYFQKNTISHKTFMSSAHNKHINVCLPNFTALVITPYLFNYSELKFIFSQRKS